MSERWPHPHPGAPSSSISQSPTAVTMSELTMASSPHHFNQRHHGVSTHPKDLERYKYSPLWKVEPSQSYSFDQANRPNYGSTPARIPDHHSVPVSQSAYPTTYPIPYLPDLREAPQHQRVSSAAYTPSHATYPEYSPGHMPVRHSVELSPRSSLHHTGSHEPLTTPLSGQYEPRHAASGADLPKNESPNMAHLEALRNAQTNDAFESPYGYTKAGKPRKRLQQACTTCRQKKIKCLPKSLEENCGPCQRSGLVCVFVE
jgi:hypothetical protein